jgi:ubiquinone/menaquinone biosynthesis C-methylase UbiE
MADTTSPPSPTTWRDYWNGPHPIYVSERHRMLHFRQIARDLVDLVPTKRAHVLDHGCGEALNADVLAAACGKLYLFDTATSVIERLRLRHAASTHIAVLGPEELELILDGSLDLVIANSLLQYLSVADLTALLSVWRRKLKPGGTVALCDVIPPDVSPVTDALALLRFGAQGGFLMAAGAGLVRTALSDYRKLRQELGLTMHREADLSAMLSDAGFVNVRRRPQNIGHNQARYTLLADVAGD